MENIRAAKTKKMLITKLCSSISSALADESSTLTMLQDLHDQFQARLAELDESFREVQLTVEEEELEGEVSRQHDFRQEKMAIVYPLMERLEAMKAEKAASLPSGASKTPPRFGRALWLFTSWTSETQITKN